MRKNNNNPIILILIKEELSILTIKPTNSTIIHKPSLFIKMSISIPQIQWNNNPKDLRNSLTLIFQCHQNTKICSTIFYPPLNTSLNTLNKIKRNKSIFKFPRNLSSSLTLPKCWENNGMKTILTDTSQLRIRIKSRINATIFPLAILPVCIRSILIVWIKSQSRKWGN